MNTIMLNFLILFSMLFVGCSQQENSISVKAQTDENMISYGNNKEVGNYIIVDGAKQYYEVYGQGKPLVWSGQNIHPDVATH